LYLWQLPFSFAKLQKFAPKEKHSLHISLKMISGKKMKKKKVVLDIMYENSV
jgi:hypothetical protein